MSWSLVTTFGGIVVVSKVQSVICLIIKPLSAGKLNEIIEEATAAQSWLLLTICLSQNKLMHYLKFFVLRIEMG
jgi:hypothetical protein